MKKIIVFILFSASISVFALPESLNEYVLRNTTWETDLSSKSFISTRCSIVNLITSERLSGDNRSDSKQLGNNYKTLSTTFALYSDVLFTVGGGSKDKFQERALHWTKIYGDVALSNINSFNNMTHGKFGEDLLFCNKTMYEFILKDLESINQEH
jgi:hypothetical protein